MNIVKVFFVITVIASCFILNAYSLKCATCNGINSCKNPTKYDCTFSIANSSLTYLNYHYNDVDQGSSSTYMCFSDNFQDATGEYTYSGCIFAETQPCTLRLKSDHGQSYSRCCNQCNKDNCNPAGRASISTMILAGVLVVGATAKRLLY